MSEPDVIERMVLDRWFGTTHITVRCPGRNCYPQNVQRSDAGFAWECFSAQCPMIPAASSGLPGEAKKGGDDADVL